MDLLVGGEEDKMNLRISLVLITILAWVSIFGVLIYKSDIGEEKDVQESSFFYRISSQDITNISITHNTKTFSWYLGADRVWYFDDMNNVPTDNYRWGGIIDLLAGPKLYRTISENIEDKSKYGLENPQTEISIYLNNGDKRTLYIGNETPDNQNNYAYLEGVDKLVMLDATWKGVLIRLVNEPPYPKWMSKLIPEEAIEIVVIKNSEIYKAFAKNNEGWHECIVPISSTPCNGDKQTEYMYIENFLEEYSNIEILGAVKLNLMFEEDYKQYGLGLNAPYIDIKTISRDEAGTNTIYNTSISIGKLSEDQSGYFSVVKETKDVVLTERYWTEKVLRLFD